MTLPDPSHLSTILLTGASGYAGGRLLPALLSAGYSVRCMARQPDALISRIPSLVGRDRAEAVEVISGDVLEPDSLDAAMAGCDGALYFVHSMGSRDGFEERDRRGAENFARAAANAGVRRMVYLGGLGHGDELSPHLASRHEVGRILASHGVATTELRASIIIGSSSLSFEMIRSLIERLPVMTTPRWVHRLAQPISIEDIIQYVLAALSSSPSGNVVYEIGGPESVSYGDLMREYARQRGLRRWIIPVPFLSVGLSSKWLGLVTPLYARIGRKIIDSVQHDTVVRDNRALRDFPQVRPRGVTAAIARALENEDHEFAQTRWSDAVSSSGDPPAWGGAEFGKRLIESRKAHVAAPLSQAFAPIRRIGGRTGWYYGNKLWKIRAYLDLLVGGVGMRRGRPHPTEIRVGDALDFWRVEAVRDPRLLRLRAEMKLPGRAWLQFEVEPDPTGDGSIITQTAVFDPVGLLGRVYWYGLWPLHQLVFAGMLTKIARAAAPRPQGA